MAGLRQAEEPEWFVAMEFFSHVVEYASRLIEIENGSGGSSEDEGIDMSEDERVDMNEDERVDMNEEERIDLDQYARDLLPANIESEDYLNAIEVLGKAVCTLQLLIRGRLRSFFFESMLLFNAAVGAKIEFYHQISEFMCQGYLQHDIFKTTLTSFAIVGDLNLFLDEFRLSLPWNGRFMPLVSMYNSRLKGELLAHGGWEELFNVARRMYIDNGLYEEILECHLNGLPIPHAEVYDINRPEDPPLLMGNDPDVDRDRQEFLRLVFGVAPRGHELATRILQDLFISRDLIPPDF